jgi:hypothetical protein
VIERVQKNPTTAFAAPGLPSLTWGWPVLTLDDPKPVPGASWGGDGGTPFEDVGPGPLLPLQKLTELQLRGEGYVDCLVCTYGGGTPLRHGGSRGNAQQPMALAADEYLSQISGRAGRYVDYLKLVSATGKTTEAGGGGGNYAFSWRTPPGQLIVGFAGSSYGYLDHITPLVCTIKPTTWMPTGGRSDLTSDSLPIR